MFFCFSFAGSPGYSASPLKQCQDVLTIPEEPRAQSFEKAFEQSLISCRSGAQVANNDDDDDEEEDEEGKRGMIMSMMMVMLLLMVNLSVPLP